MGLLASGVFWGVVLVLLGFSVILRAVLHIDIPLFRILFAFLLIHLGMRVLVGDRKCRRDGTCVLFGRQDLRPVEGRKDYTIVFSKGSLDLTGVRLSGGTREIEFTTVFGESRLVIPKGVPFRIEASAAFARIRLPNGNCIVFGEMHHAETWTDGGPALDIEVHGVFADVVVEMGEGSPGGPPDPATTPPPPDGPTGHAT